MHNLPLDYQSPTLEKSARTRTGGSVKAFTNLNGNWAALRAVAQREENYVTALEAQVAFAPVERVPLLDRDIHDLDGVQTVADHLFGLSGAGHRPANPGIPPSTAQGSRLQSSPHPGDPVESSSRNSQPIVGTLRTDGGS
jgi:hypothetical protein